MIKEKDINKKFKARCKGKLAFEDGNYRRKVEMLEEIENSWGENDYNKVLK